MTAFERFINLFTFANFNSIRKSFGLAFLLCGSALIYFFRDGLGLAPGSSTFTAISFFVSLFLIFPLGIPERIYMPNKLMAFFSFCFLVLAFCYMLVYSPNRGWFTKTDREVIYFLLIFLCFAVFMTISAQEIDLHFMSIVYVVSALGCIGLLYIIFTNPLYLFGARASIKLGNDQASTENPHIFAKNALFGILAILSIYRTKGKLPSILVYPSAILFLITLALTQSMNTMLVLLLCLGVTAALNFNGHSVIRVVNVLFSLRFIKIYLVLALLLGYLLLFTRAPEFIGGLFEMISTRFGKILDTITGAAKPTDMKSIDYSASGRVETIKEFFGKIDGHWQEGRIWKLLFGNGYQDFFFDNPILETYNDLGVLGFFFFVGWQLTALYVAIKEISRPTNTVVLFASYMVLYLLVQNLTGGMPYDYTRWTLITFCTRFLIRRVWVLDRPAAKMASAA